MQKIVFTTLLLSMFVSLQAATLTWNGSVNNLWNEAGNWTPSQIPTFADDVILVPTVTSTVIVWSGQVANAKSITANDVTFNVDGTLTVDGIAPGYLVSTYFDNVAFANNNQAFFNGGLKAENSNLINYSLIAMDGSIDNTPTMLILDHSTQFFNAAAGVVYCYNNIESGTGNHKSAFISMNDQSLIDNYGLMYIQHNATTNDYVLNGIIVNNKSTLINYLGGNIQLFAVRDVGLEIQNGALGTPFALVENYGNLYVSECGACNNDPLSVGIRAGQHGKFVDFPGSGSTTVVSGFLNSSPQISISSCIIFNSTPVAPFNPGTMLLSVGSTMGGNGPVMNAGYSFAGTISPGLSPGTITFLDDFSATSQADFLMEMAGNNGPGDPTGHDQIVFQGTTSDINGVTLNVALIDGFVPDLNDEFILFTGPYTGTFSSIDLPGDEASWDLQYNSNEVVLVLNSALLNLDNVGVGTVEPKTKLHVKDGDVYLETVGAGLIMKDANGVCYKIVVLTDGSLSAQVLSTCP